MKLETAQELKRVTRQKCESDGLIYTSNPPQLKCKNCGKFWFKHEKTPYCDKQLNNNKSV